MTHISQRLAGLKDGSAASPVGPLEMISFRTFAEFQNGADQLGQEFMARRGREMALARTGGDPVRYEGQCGMCGVEASFSCDWSIFYTHPDGVKEPVWRERLVCPCGLNPRLRGALHFLLGTCGMVPASAVYLTEQTTPLFHLLKQFSDDLVGSEFLQDGTASGATDSRGIRHEDITALSMADESFDIIGSFEVLEHVPDYLAGLNEFYRVLKPGGHLLATFPFRADLNRTLVRAQIGADGAVEHLLEPEFHGDPLSEDGVLCFYHFGWDILDDLRKAGFRDARCLFYWSWEEGYLGGALPMFQAVK